MRWFVACLCLSFLLPAAAGTPASEPEVELDGWRLQQFAGNVDKELGAPFKEIDQAPFHYKAYMVGKEAYLVVGTRAPLVNNIDSLQLSGASASALTLRGLRLGDPAVKVRAALGAPDSVTPVKELDVVRWDYTDRNYSVEIDRKDRLFSVLLLTTESVITVPAGTDDPWAAFKAAIESGQFARIEPWLRPDVEVYRSGQTLAIRDRFSRFRQHPDPALQEALTGKDRSVRTAIAQHEPEGALRVTQNLGVGMVFKFPESSALEELVFFPYAGRWRLFEVAFREHAPTKLGTTSPTAGQVAAE